MLDYYRAHSQWTNPGAEEGMFRDIPDDIGSVVRSVQGCLMHAGLVWLYDLTPSEAQGMGFQIRRTEETLRRIEALDAAPLSAPRPKETRVLGCIEHCSRKGLPLGIADSVALASLRS
jgi:hypothetical protein